MIVEEYEAKSLVRQSGVSIFSWAEIYLNPYQGCYHNCRYCDGKAEHYHMHEDFGSRIKVKSNAPILFEKFLRKKKFSPVHKKEQFAIYEFFPKLKEDESKHTVPKSIITVGGGVCDVYQPAEKDVKMTRRLLEIVYDYQMPLWILTKSNLVLRDLELIKEINKETYACVNFTITLNDENDQKIFEPGASTTTERFEAIRTLRKEGIHSGIYFYPVLPFIGDTEENIESIYTRAKDVGAEFVYCFGLTLKPGRNKEEFMSVLKEHYPKKYPLYKRLYGNNNKYGNLDYKVFKEMGLVWPEIKGYKHGYEKGLEYTAERYPPAGRIEANLKVAELLLKIAHLKSQILQRPRYEISDLVKAANFVEKSKRDFGSLEEDDFEDIPTKKQIQLIIKEYILNNKSKYLKELEKEAYDYVIKKYYS